MSGRRRLRLPEAEVDIDDPTVERTGVPVPVRYAGPPLTPWSAAMMWAKVIAAHADARQRPEPDHDSYHALLVMLARAITIDATEGGLISVDQPRVDSPQALADVLLTSLALRRLVVSPLMIEFGAGTLGCVPDPDEPGYQTYTWWTDELKTLADYALQARSPQLDPTLDQLASDIDRQWLAHSGWAVHTVRAAIIDNVTRDTPETAPIGILGGYLNRYLSA